MKKLLLLITLLVGTMLQAQVPNSFSYRSAVFGADSLPIVNQKVRVDIKIQTADGEDAEVQYAESHHLTTNERGLFYLQIGSGKAGESFNSLGDVLWTEGEKFVNVSVYNEAEDLISSGTSQLMSVPYALVAGEVAGGNRNFMGTVLENLNDLRAETDLTPGRVVYVKGHSNYHDGGQGFFYYNPNYEFTDSQGDDKGVIIKPNAHTDIKTNGRWLRDIDGHINVNYYGITSGTNSDPTITSTSDRIQLIINYAASNVRKQFGPDKATKGNVIFFPNGEYIIDKTLILKSGISIIGEGDNTLFTAGPGASYDYMFTNVNSTVDDGSDQGHFHVHMEMFVLNGRYCVPGEGCNQPANVGGMYFKAISDGDTGGIQRSKFKNIQIVNIAKHGIHLRGGTNGAGTNDTSLPNQHNVFENVIVDRRTDNGHALFLEGQQSENIFIRCVFAGNRLDPLNEPNVLLDNQVSGSTGVGQSNGNMFMNCGFGLSKIAVELRDSENITFDTCWFENTMTAVNLVSAEKIKIVNSRFANACGYGSENEDYPTGPGQYNECIRCKESSVNIENNYVLVSNISKIDDDTVFIRGIKDAAATYADNTIIARDNGFKHHELSKTFGILQYADVSSEEITVDGKKQVFANYGGQQSLRKINGTHSSGEILYIRANRTSGLNGNLTIHSYSGANNGQNIYLNGQPSITLQNFEWAAFIKVDNPIGSTGAHATYQLVSTSIE